MTDARFRLGDWLVDPASYRLSRDGREARLEPKVMQVLACLADHAGQVVSRRELEAEVWPGMVVTDDAVTNTVIKLRKALGDDARRPVYVETIAKSGYRLIAPVAPDPEGAAPPTGLDQAAGVRAAPGATRPGHAARRRSMAQRAAVLGLVLLVGLGTWWLMVRSPSLDPTGTPVALPKRPVVAVLPFENLTADPAQDYFADGITEDLITDLSKLSGLQVLARNSTLAYRGSTATEQRIGRELGARFLVEGSVQRSGGRLRINVQLIDTVEGRNRWAERYDRELTDVFRIQDDIVARVVAALQVELAAGEQQRLGRRYTASIEAYDEFLRGLDLLGRRASADNPEARAHFERAIALEPGFARAYAGLAMTYALHAVYGAGAAVGPSLRRAEQIARRGLAIDDTVPQLRYALGLAETYQGNLAAAIAEVSRAIELRPSYADGYGLLAWILHFAGRPTEGLEAMQRAIALNPHVTALYRTVEGALHYQLGNLDRSLDLLQQAAQMSPNQLLTRLFLAAVLAADGQLDAARWQVEELHALDPAFTLDLDSGFPIRDPVYRERLLADLRRAGLAAE
jgi:TolB-like protein/DNA-binding winged helix-turn-helix (wHTH) protein/Tfp pilus assembly protein PilF